MPFEHDTIKSLIAEGIDATQDARNNAERSRDYYDGEGQWTAAERATLKKRKQPVITHNLLKRKVDAMVGIEQRGRTDPVAYPREPKGQEAADIATKALRFVEETQRVDAKASEVFYNICIEGTGGVEVIAEESGDGIDVTVNRIRWEELIYDPHSREKDYSDAGYTGIIKWMTVDKAKAFLAGIWQGEEEDLEALLDTQATETGDTYADRPNKTGLQWYDKKLKRVRVAQIYYLCEGQWYWSVLTGRGEIVNTLSPWLDDKGKPHNPMVLATAYIDRENNRYGFLLDLLSLQDEVNKRRSKMLHMLSSRQTWGVKGAVESVAKLKEELAKPDGHVEIDPAYAQEGMLPPFNVLNNNDQLAGQASLLADAVSAIDNLGPNAALMGQMGSQASGRAMMAAQQAGMAELAPIYDSKRDWTERAYRHIWMRIKQVWTAPKWIRVTSDLEAPQFIGLNMPMQDPMTGMPQVDPMTGQPVLQNPVAEMDVDIIVEQAPEYATLRAEQFEKLAEMAQSGLPIPPQVIIEASDLHDKKRILEAMQGDPAQAQLGQRAAQAEIAVKETQAARNDAAAQKDLATIGKIQAEAENTNIKTRDAAFDATTKQVMTAKGIMVQ